MIRLFRPVPTDLLVKYFAYNLANWREGKSDPAYRLRLVQLMLALAARKVEPCDVAPAALDQEEASALGLLMCNCYNDAAKNATTSDLEQYYVRLIANDLDDLARPIRDELEKRGQAFSSWKAIKAVQEDLAEASAVDEFLDKLKTENKLLADLIENSPPAPAPDPAPRHAWPYPDSEHDSRLHATLKPQMRAYNQRWHYE